MTSGKFVDFFENFNKFIAIAPAAKLSIKIMINLEIISFLDGP